MSGRGCDTGARRGTRIGLGARRAPLDSMRSTSILSPLAALLAACGGGDVATDPVGRLDRPALYAIGDAEVPRERVDRLPVPDGLGKWQLTGRTARTPVGSDGERRILLEAGADPALLTVPVRLLATELDFVRVSGVFPGEYRVTLQLGGEGIEPFRPPTLGTRNDASEQTLVFDLSKVSGRPMKFTQLDLLVDGPARPVELSAIEAVDAPDGVYLAQPDAPGEMIDLDDGVGRSANGLTTLVPVGCRFLVEDERDRLAFSVALAPRMRPWGGKPRVRVTVAGPGGGTATETLSLEGDRSERARWHDGTIALDDFVGQEVEATFEYLCDAAQPGAVALAEVQVWRPRLDPPTVLYVSSDTHRADHVNAARLGVEIDTPALDALAETGLFFENCWTTTNVTSPSHVAMMTGVHPRDTRLVTNIDRLAPQALTLAEVYRDAGWGTLAAVSVRHLGPRGTDLGQGFDRMLAPTSEPWDAEVPVDQLLDWMEENEGKPLFLFLHFFDAHHPYAPPPAFDRRYYPKDKDPSDMSLPPIDARPGSMPMDMLAGNLRDLEYPKAQYRAEVSYLDSQLARIFAVPRVEAGLIAVTADHGEVLVKNGTYFNHGELYPDTLHVPLVLGGGALPEDVRGQRVGARVAQLDLPRTLLDLSGLGAVDFPGRILLNALGSDPNAAGEHFALAAHGNSASLAEGRWFLLLHLRNHQGTHPQPRTQHQVELFDLELDPECLVDVSAENADVVDDLRTRLVAWLLDSAPTSLSTKRVASAAELATLRELGYSTDAAVIEEEPWYAPEKGPEKGPEKE